MDYSKLSDSEINHYVACQFPDVYLFNEHGAPYVLVPDTLASYSGQDFEKVYFEPCTNVADAWPIIVENRITLDADVDIWFARSDNFVCTDQNPLRAAMIVFLKMNDA